jgi:hypothetical protein
VPPKEDETKTELGKEGYLGYADGGVFQKISSMIGLDFHIPVFLESLGGSCFYIPKISYLQLLLLF